MASDLAPNALDASVVAWFDAIPCAVVVADGQGTIRAANPLAEATLGYAVGELIGMPVEILVPTRVREGHVAKREGYVGVHHRMGAGRILEAVRKDGRVIPVEISLVPLKSSGANKPTIAAFIVDVSARQEAIARYRTLFEKASDAMLIVSGDGIIQEANGNACVLFDVARERIVGSLMSNLVDAAAGGDKAPFVFRLDVEHDTNVHREKVPLRLGDGKLVYADISASVIPLDRERVVVMMLRDVTAQHQMQAQLHAADRMASIGTLAAGIAHDFNNMLSVILSYTSLVLGDLPTDSVSREDLEEIRKAGERASDLTRQLLAFSRRQTLQPRVLDLNQVVANMEGMARRLLGGGVTLTVMAAPTLRSVKADAGQLEQVLLNLVVNARDAMPRGGTLTIETADTQVDDVAASGQLDVAAGRYVTLSVTDTGIGMDDATKARIFEPFFTTKDKGQGTGLGLGTVFGIVRQSDGFITVASEPGRGARFAVHLPAILEHASQQPVVGSRAPAPMSGRGTETILVVEDDDQVRGVARGILRRSGYTVLEASNGGEALMACEAHDGPIHLLLIDLDLPRVSGTEVAARLASLRPAMRHLVMSGYGGTVPVGTERLDKPLRPETLVKKVREVLDAE